MYCIPTLAAHQAHQSTTTTNYNPLTPNYCYCLPPVVALPARSRPSVLSPVLKLLSYLAMAASFPVFVSDPQHPCQSLSCFYYRAVLFSSTAQAPTFPKASTAQKFLPTIHFSVLDNCRQVTIDRGTSSICAQYYLLSPHSSLL